MRISIGDCRLFVDVEGLGLVPDGKTMRAKPTLILLHGGPGFDHSGFKPQWSQFADLAQVVYYDHRGQGRSDRSDPSTWHLQQWAADLVALCDALARRYAVDPARVVVGCGSVPVFGHLRAATCDAGDEVVYAWHSFEAYPIYVRLSGATAVPVPVSDDGRLDLPAMAAAVTERTRVVLICSPTNPTGPAVHAPHLEAYLAAGDADAEDADIIGSPTLCDLWLR